jgi:energy-coupling factor transporter ATP-binding protein EcfA2
MKSKNTKAKNNKNIKSNKIINFYELEGVKKFNFDYVNPNYNFETMPLKHPMRLLICGATGSGKSNILLNIMMLMENTFEKIIIFTQDKKEKLYLYLEDTLDPDLFEIFEGIESVKKYNFDNLEDKQHLIIFDDMCIESAKKQKPIEEIFIRGRKMANMFGVSAIYLTQSYFLTPYVIRKQLTGLILRKINGKRDASNILRETSIDATTKQLLNLYNACCDPDDIQGFLFIDFNAPEKARFRYQFDQIVDINNFS